MARARSFTDEQVIEAVSNLRHSGTPINRTNLRLEIGKGRPSAIWDVYTQLVESKIIDPEQEKLEVVEVSPELKSQPLPSEVEDGLQMALGEVERMIRFCNDQAHNIHEQRVAKEISDSRKAREVAEQKEREATTKLESTLEVLGATEENYDELKEKAQQTERELETCKGQFDAEQKNNKKLEQGVNSLTIKCEEQTKLINEQQFKLDTLSAELEKANIAGSELNQRNSELSEQVVRSEESVKHLTEEVEKAKQRETTLTDKIKSQEASALKQAQKIEQQQTDNGELQKQLAVAQEKNNNYEENSQLAKLQISELTNTSQEQTATIQAKEEELLRLQTENRKIDVLKTTIEQQETTIEHQQQLINSYLKDSRGEDVEK